MDVEQQLAVAWAAGFIDGEGYFTVYHRASDGVVSPRVIATQQVREPLDALAAIFGGAVIVHSYRDDRTVRAWKWYLSGARSCAPAIDALRPYLRLKGSEADVVRRLCDRIFAFGGGRMKPMTDPELRARLALAEELAALKGERRRTRPLLQSPTKEDV